MPTKHTALFRSIRAAAMVIISSDVNAFSGMRGLQRLAELREILRVQNVPLDPSIEAFAVPRNHIPGFVERVVAGIVALRIRRKRPASNLAHRSEERRVGKECRSRRSPYP